MVGIGGIGMSALAQLLVNEGKTVTGSDREPTLITSMLNEQGVSVYIGHLDELPEGTEAVIYSDAVPIEDKERTEASNNNIPQFSYFEGLGEISKNKFTITISGTHGKTTTTGILGKILFDSKKDPTIVVGSLMKDFKSNFVSGKKGLLVAEGCEYKDHLLKLDTNILVITNIEFDHPDHFKDLRHVQETFKTAVDQLPDDGVIITNPNDANIAPVLEGVTKKVIDYTKVDVSDTGMKHFDEMNAKAAKATALAYDSSLEDKEINKSISSFGGTWRRFEYKGTTQKGTKVYDDYAHHPTAVAVTLLMAKEMPFEKIAVAFHPHLISRTKAFFNEFADALSIADKIIVAPIYRARSEKEEEGITSEKLVEVMKSKGQDAKYIESFSDIKKELEENTGDVDLIITMGAGDIYKVSDDLVN